MNLEWDEKDTRYKVIKGISKQVDKSGQPDCMKQRN